jgi:hypothetical protein
MGQKQTSRRLRIMSAIPPKADIAGRRRHVRFVPKADIRAMRQPLDLSNSVQACVTFRNNFRVQPILWLPRIMPQDQCSHGFNLL